MSLLFNFGHQNVSSNMMGHEGETCNVLTKKERKKEQIHCKIVLRFDEERKREQERYAHTL
jgi:hypothetical protein